MASSGRIVIIINPISGTGGRLHVARDRAEQASALIRGCGFEPEIFITERPGHARELAQAALARGASRVVAWGGDGTVNEVGSALVFHDATLGIVPCGSGNGLARELRIPFAPAEAIAAALGGPARRIDAGELDGRLFFNVAGVGLDAQVAHRFAQRTTRRRGFLRYVAMTASEMGRYRADQYTIVVGDETLRVRPLLIAIANGRQYGNGALIAPSARLDDGRLDLVVVSARSPLAALVRVPQLFTGRIAAVPGVMPRSVTALELTAGRPQIYHVDGEPFVGGVTIRAAVRPAALRVAVPVSA